MKTLTKSLFVIGIAAGIGGLMLIPPTFASGDKRFSGSHMSAMGHHGMARRGMHLFERFDTNEDGVVTQNEIDQTRSGLIKKFDADNDGNLSLKEYEGLWLDFMRDRMVDRFQQLDRDGDAMVTIKEFSVPMKYIIRMMDTDDDGQISVDEFMQRHGRDSARQKRHGGRHHGHGSDRR